MSDYMKEMERLVSDLIDAAHGTVMTEDQEREDTARAALLAHAAQADRDAPVELPKPIDLLTRIESARMLEGWKEACIAWEICASVHSQWAKDKDALFSTRQADYKRHAEDARAKALAAATPQPPHNAPVKFPEPVEVPIQYQEAKIGTEDGGDAYAAGYFDGEAAGYARGRAEQQAVIDRLMLEHCPDEMTAEQRQTWAAAQAEKGGE